jgi:hypothetical protein
MGRGIDPLLLGWSLLRFPGFDLQHDRALPQAIFGTVELQIRRGQLYMRIKPVEAGFVAFPELA